MSFLGNDKIYNSGVQNGFFKRCKNLYLSSNYDVALFDDDYKEVTCVLHC